MRKKTTLETVIHEVRKQRDVLVKSYSKQAANEIKLLDVAIMLLRSKIFKKREQPRG